MPEVVLNCPRCQRQLRVTEDLIGKLVKCPACELTFVIPAGSAEAQPVAPPGAGGPTLPELPRNVEPVFAPGELPAHGSPGGPYGDSSHRAASIVLPAAIALLFSGVLGALWNVLQIVNIQHRGLPAPEDVPEAFRDAWREAAKTVTPQLMITISAIFLCISLLTVAGAIQMSRGRMYPLAIAGSILAFFQQVPCCCLGILIGIWSLVVLLRPDVRAWFAMHAKEGI
jgi:predicted Zn finger-like uncharacterized protein